MRVREELLTLAGQLYHVISLSRFKQVFRLNKTKAVKVFLKIMLSRKTANGEISEDFKPYYVPVLTRLKLNSEVRL